MRTLSFISPRTVPAYRWSVLRVPREQELHAARPSVDKQRKHRVLDQEIRDVPHLALDTPRLIRVAAAVPRHAVRAVNARGGGCSTPHSQSIEHGVGDTALRDGVPRAMYCDTGRSRERHKRASDTRRCAVASP